MTHETPLAAAARLSHRPLLATLDAKIQPAHTALLVIDMQNDFCADGGMVARGGRDVASAHAVAQALPPLIATARAAGVLIIFVRNAYSTTGNIYLSDAWLEQAGRKQGGGYTLYPCCEPDSWGAEFAGAIRPGATDPVVTKHRYSAFHNTDLDTILRAKAIRTLVLTGVTTDVCVGSTARDGFMRDYYIVVSSDGTAAYSREDHEATLRNIDRFFGEITTIETLATHWAPNCEG
jgi:ureidoacrylate peracid hydrolase